MAHLASRILLSDICRTLRALPTCLSTLQLLILGLFSRGCKVLHAACGGVTHWALAPSDDDESIMTIAFGQGASNGKPPTTHTSLTDPLNSSVGELGLGPNEGKSATKPTRNQPLNGVEVFQ